MRYVLFVLWMLFGSVTSAMAQVSVGIGLPGVSIGINLPVYPELVPVPGYPVYYAPGMNSNYFFYDGMYWVYQEDNWYASSWYNGPWGLVGPEVVPLFVLRIPVRYYRDPPGYFRGWRSDAPPRWGQHWGNQWEQRRRGWDRWNHASAPRLAPLPVYQRQYSGDRYPRAEQQQALRSQNYRYQPRDAVARQHFREQAVQTTPAPSQRGQQGTPQQRSPGQRDVQRSAPAPLQPGAPAVTRSQPLQRGGESVQRAAPTQTPPQQRGPAIQDQGRQPQQGAVQRERGGENVQRSAPTQAPPQQRGPAVQDQSRQPQQGAVQREQRTPRASPENIQRSAPTPAPPQQRAPAVQDRPQPQPQQGAVQREQRTPRTSPDPQGKGASPEPRRGQGQEKDRGKGEERGQERNR